MWKWSFWKSLRPWSSREKRSSRQAARCLFLWLKGNRPFEEPITIGYEQDRMVEVLKGLNEGDQVVIKGQQLIKDGSAIRVIEGS